MRRLRRHLSRFSRCGGTGSIDGQDHPRALSQCGLTLVSMSIVVPPGFANCQYLFELSGDPEWMATAVGVDLGGATDYQAVADSLAQQFIDVFPISAIADVYTFRGTKLTVGQAGGPPIIVEAAYVHIGNVASATFLPQNCAFLIRKGTALGGRQGRGRMYLPPFPIAETQVNHLGQLVAASQASLQGKINSWLLPEIEKVLFHDASQGAMAPTPITSFLVDARIATQRRRLRS